MKKIAIKENNTRYFPNPFERQIKVQIVPNTPQKILP